MTVLERNAIIKMYGEMNYLCDQVGQEGDPEFLQ